MALLDYPNVSDEGKRQRTPASVWTKSRDSDDSSCFV